MEFNLAPEQRILLESVRTLMKRHAGPDYVRSLFRERAFPYELFDAWVDAGLLRLPFPESYGGAGGTIMDVALVVDEISRTSIDFQMVYAGTLFCGLNVLRKGSEEQKLHWLPQVMEGKIKMVIGMSEPDAGSDVGAMRTVAQRADGRWIINGQKIWITGAGVKNAVINAYVKTNPSVHYREGISLFLVDNNTPGIEARKLEMLGRGCSGTYEVFFKDVEVPSDRLIGGENKGWECMMSGLEIERVMSAASNCGAAQAIVDLAAQYSQERIQFGRPIGTNQSIAHMIADMQTEVEAARLLLWRAAWMVTNQQKALREVTMAKLFSSEIYTKIANMGMQIMGAMGLNAECDMHRYFRDSRSATIAAGTSQMQRNLIARLQGLKVH